MRAANNVLKNATAGRPHEALRRVAPLSDHAVAERFRVPERVNITPVGIPAAFVFLSLLIACLRRCFLDALRSAAVSATRSSDGSSSSGSARV